MTRSGTKLLVELFLVNCVRHTELLIPAQSSGFDLTKCVYWC